MRALVGIDLGDERANLVVAEAARFARAMHATLDVAYVDGLLYASAMVLDPMVRDLLAASSKKLQHDRQVQLSELVATVPDEVRGVARYLSSTSPAETLVSAAEGYDVLFVATHGRRGLGHLLLGSVSERVIRLATVPTLVLRISGV